MKTYLHSLFLCSALMLANSLFSQVVVSNNFQNFTDADGLVNNDVKDILMENDSNIWIGTVAGLSHYDGISFTNYTSSSTNLNNDNISELEFCQNKIWMVTDSGISSFDGQSFANYTTSNGLVSSSILGLAATNSDTLWMTSTNGTGKFDGNNFTNYSSQAGRDIETDSLDRVYVMRATVANAFPFARLYENGAWSMPAQSGINFGINGAKLIKTASNNLYVAGFASNPTVFVRIDYPLNCVPQPVYTDNAPHTNISSSAVNPQQLEELNGVRWMGAGNNVPFYVASADSNYVNQYISNSIAVSSCIKANGDLLAIGSDRGLYITKPNIKSSENGLEFAVNNIRTSVTTTDPLFSDLLGGGPNFEFPKDSSSHGIYAANFIVAAKKASQTSFEVYPTSPYFQAYTPGPRTSTGGLSKSFIVKVLKSEIESHKMNFTLPNYLVPSSILDWPAVGDSLAGVATDLAPFFDFNNNGCYDPQNGDYPIIKADEAVYWINHPNIQNLELEYHWMMYAFVDTSLTLDQTVFVDYTIVNRANVAQDSMKVGFFLDADLGNSADDYVGCDSLNDIMYSYNGTLFDAGLGAITGYGNNTPAVGVKFTSDPMETMVYYNIGTANNGDPTNKQHWLNYMNAKWKNGQDVKYGGNGFNTFGVSAVSTTHMFTGDPFTRIGWTELDPGAAQVSNVPGDRRLLGSIPYFSLQPNERKTIGIAVGFGRTSDTTSQIAQNVRELINVLNGANTHNTSINLPTLTFANSDTCNSVTSIQDVVTQNLNTLSVFPVPSTGELTIGTEDQMILIEVYDMKGSKVISLPVRQNSVQLSLTNYRNGFYMVRVQMQDETWRMKKIMKQ